MHIAELGDLVDGLVASAVADRCEGVMVKPLSGSEAVYVPASRTKAWAKLKKDAAGGVGGDTLDVVPVAMYVACFAPVTLTARGPHCYVCCPRTCCQCEAL